MGALEERNMLLGKDIENLSLNHFQFTFSQAGRGEQLSHSCDLCARILLFCYVEDRCHIIVRTFINPYGDIYVVRSWGLIPSANTKLPSMLVSSSHGHSSAEVQIAHSQDYGNSLLEMLWEATPKFSTHKLRTNECFSFVSYWASG